MADRLRIEDQVGVRWLLNALCSGPKLQILRILLTEGPLTATEITRRLGVKLSTTLNHLEGLLASGLVEVEVSGGNRIIKRYKVKSPIVEAVIDLRDLLSPQPCTPPERVAGEAVAEAVDPELEALALEYVNAKRRSRRAKLQIRPKVRDVAATLGVDLDTAIEVTRYLNTHQRRLAKVICGDVLKALQERGGRAAIKDVADALRVHPYWVVLCVNELSREGRAVLREGVISLVKSTGQQRQARQ